MANDGRMSVRPRGCAAVAAHLLFLLLKTLQLSTQGFEFILLISLVTVLLEDLQLLKRFCRGGSNAIELQPQLHVGLLQLLYLRNCEPSHKSPNPS